MLRAIAIVTGKSDYNEFKVLAGEAGYKIVDTVKVRNLKEAGLSHVKIEELKEKIIKNRASEIICDTDLKPKQIYNIAKEVKIAPKTRIEIILEIFKKHSPSKEADLQIKLASLHYELARAREKVRLAKIGEQPGFYGLGSYEVDVYYNEIKRRIQSIKRKLEIIRTKRDLHRKMRKKLNYKTIAIAGYTCSGKSSLFNALTGLSVNVGPEPFTTLSTKFHTLRIGPWNCYIIDTIGFIRDLPPFMINAFYSTLEEISFADLILLVIDVSEAIQDILSKLKTSLEIIHQIGGADAAIIIVANKIDLLSKSKLNEVIKELAKYDYPVVPVSALYRKNIDKLVEVITRKLGRILKVSITVPYYSLKNYDYQYTDVILNLKKFGVVNQVSYNDNFVMMSGLIPFEFLKSIRRLVKRFGGHLKIEGSMGP